MSEILGYIYGRSVAIVLGIVIFGTEFFSTFWRLWKRAFWRKMFQNLILMFYFHPKNYRTSSRKTSITSIGEVSRRKLPDPSLSNTFNILSIGLR